MPETEPKETTKEDGQQVDFTTGAYREHVQQAVTAANASLEANRDAIKLEKTAVEKQRDAYALNGTAEEVAEKLKRLDDLDLAEKARVAKTTPDALKTAVEVEMATYRQNYDTRMGEVQTKLKTDTETALKEVETLRESEFSSLLMAEILEEVMESMPPELRIFRPGAISEFRNALLPFAHRVDPPAKGLPAGLRFQIDGQRIPGGLPDGQMGLAELLKLARKPHKGGVGVLPRDMSWYYRDAGAATDSHTPAGETGGKFDWGKASQEERTAWAAGKSREERRSAIDASRSAAA